jgi:PrtD family type I secretion system ABC transporter
MNENNKVLQQQSNLANSEKSDFLKLLKESLKKGIFYILIFSSIINLLMLMLPLYSLQVFDRVLSSGSIPTLTALSLIAIFCFFLYSIFNSVREYILIKISSWLDEKLNDRIFKLSVNHSSLSGQKMNSKFLSEANSVKSFVTSPAIFSVFDLPWSFVFIFVIYLISPQIALLVIVGAIILFALTYYKDFKTKPQIMKTSEIAHKNLKRGDEFIRNAEVIEAMGMFSSTYKVWKDEHNHIQERNSNTAYLSSKLNSISKCIRMILQIAIIGLGTYLALNKQMTFGGIIACSILAGKALAPFDAIMSIWAQYGNFKDSYARLKSFLISADERPLATNLGKPKGDIATEKIVFFKPGTMQPIIKGIDIKITAGDVIGVIGPSGSGKSTLIKLLAGIYKPNMGITRLDGGDMQNRNREDVGKYIGYLPQSVDLLTGTIKQNISRFDEAATDEDVVNAAKKTGVHELILSLPQGYDTIIGEGFVELSGGQKQRVGLARAFYGSPSLVFLDEPNANLDQVGEMMLLRAITIAKQENITLMMISHKPSIINIVSKILVLQDGLVTDFGEKNEIMAKYTNAARKQNAAVPANLNPQNPADKKLADEEEVKNEIATIVKDISNS